MAKIPREELLFTQLLIRAGLLTLEQCQQALEIRAKLEERGVYKPLDKLVVEKGYLQEKVVENLRQKLAPKALQSTNHSCSTDAQTSEGIPSSPKGYRLTKKLGEGAMGVVFKGYHLETHSEVAIKFLDQRYNNNPDVVHRFVREARAAQQLEHPNIVRALSSGEFEGFYYLVMEYVAGGSLMTVLETEKVLSEDKALKIIRQIGLALQYAHGQGLIHRDIKPENILVGANDQAKLCDFGLARALEGDTLSTRVGTFLGTPQYVSPEQARGIEDIDCRTDMYSLGCTLYHMVTGQLPYPSNNPVAVLTAQATKPFPDPLLSAPNLSPKVVSLIRRMTAKDRKLRIPNMDTLLSAIDNGPDESEPNTAQLSAPTGTTNPMESAEKTKATRRLTTTSKRIKTGKYHSSDFHETSSARIPRESRSTLSSTRRLRESGIRKSGITMAHPQPKQGKWALVLGVSLMFVTTVVVVWLILTTK